MFLYYRKQIPFVQLDDKLENLYSHESKDKQQLRFALAAQNNSYSYSTFTSFIDFVTSPYLLASF